MLTTALSIAARQSEHRTSNVRHCNCCAGRWTAQRYRCAPRPPLRQGAPTPTAIARGYVPQKLIVSQLFQMLLLINWKALSCVSHGLQAILGRN
ncbi:hypothetical protein KCP75_18680 [Salmonella enterica subsp. enterica]|nr:hypothetical protein KCP75_18680 [Salmonella enterica subsp. enterica]